MPRSLKPFPLPTTLRSFLLALVYPLALTSSSAPRTSGDHPISLTSQNIRLPGNISNDDIGTRLDVLNDLKIECDGDKYGFNPNVRDCQEARAYYKRSAMPITYGQRHSGHEVTTFPLPFRLMGGTLFNILHPSFGCRPRKNIANPQDRSRAMLPRARSNRRLKIRRLQHQPAQRCSV